MPPAPARPAWRGCEPAAFGSAESQPGTIGPSDSGLACSGPAALRAGSARARPPRARNGGQRAGQCPRHARWERSVLQEAPASSPHFPPHTRPSSAGGRSPSRRCRPPARPGRRTGPERLGAHASWPRPRGQCPKPVPRPRPRPSSGAPGDAPASRSADSGSRAVRAAAPPGPAVSGARESQGRAGCPGASAQVRPWGSASGGLEGSWVPPRGVLRCPKPPPSARTRTQALG